ncbi:divergent PAP2 family protein [Pseudoflavonifractor capillosus]|uniref:divergent PAP2 family protein n=1 Tax=Pseudoflavonifractor capillosus TaxID=106588 RepID=UPI00195EAF8B|nr:divergent PAP2 family protein [Pseudoflavonifractor capillosus]MBM6895788.1 divergent PAP2 family protein [Pseudoflavonifractor capillosus]
MITPILFLAVAAWAIAQILKMLISMVVYRKVDWGYLFTSGGMPSSHSALVCACAAGIGMTAGFDQPVFALAVVVAFIVMYDAANVRKETGEQAKILNYIMKNWNEHRPELFAEELKELIGHTPLQVAAGAVLGVLVGVAGALLFL